MAPLLASEYSPRFRVQNSPHAQNAENRCESNKTEILKKLKSEVKFATYRDLTTKIPKLGVHTVRVVGFSDDSSIHNEEIARKLGQICFL